MLLASRLHTQTEQQLLHLGIEAQHMIKDEKGEKKTFCVCCFVLRELLTEIAFCSGRFFGNEALSGPLALAFTNHGRKEWNQECLFR